MKVVLEERQLKHVKQFYKESKNQELRDLFPFQDITLDESIKQFEASLESGARSYGKIITVDEQYIGDIWCYSIDEVKEKSCFLSIVIFDKAYWGKGIGSEAIEVFCNEIANRYAIDKICAFTYKHNVGSVRTLEKTGFSCIEEFVEDGIASYYLEKLLGRQ